MLLIDCPVHGLLNTAPRDALCNPLSVAMPIAMVTMSAAR